MTLAYFFCRIKLNDNVKYGNLQKSTVSLSWLLISHRNYKNFPKKLKFDPFLLCNMRRKFSTDWFYNFFCHFALKSIQKQIWKIKDLPITIMLMCRITNKFDYREKTLQSIIFDSSFLHDSTQKSGLLTFCFSIHSNSILLVRYNGST